MRRLHPVTKTYKAHPAIDYAAPTGTPIKTVGDGVVVKSTYNRFNGNYVKIRHPGSWVTMYNHMSRFGRGIKTGKKVRQGQIIGYVGSTGRSTGPHLDFRMYKNGRTVNPLRVKSPSVAPVSSEQMAAFKTSITPYIAQLDKGAPASTQLAVAEPQAQIETASN
jgi:murein DD-endopeptidase MepM/ murein hydrolase activator NlpD